MFALLICYKYHKENHTRNYSHKHCPTKSIIFCEIRMIRHHFLKTGRVVDEVHVEFGFKFSAFPRTVERFLVAGPKILSCVAVVRVNLVG